MLVDVVCLRHNGAKLPTDVIAAAVPVRGELTIKNDRRFDQHGARNNFIVAELAVVDGALPVPKLLDAVVTKMAADSFVVAGLEVQSPAGAGSSYQCDQTWWCRLAPAAGT